MVYTTFGFDLNAQS